MRKHFWRPWVLLIAVGAVGPACSVKRTEAPKVGTNSSSIVIPKPGAAPLQMNARGGGGYINGGAGGAVTITGKAGSLLNVQNGAYTVNTAYPPPVGFASVNFGANLLTIPSTGGPYTLTALISGPFIVTSGSITPPVPNFTGTATGLLVPAGVTLTIAGGMAGLATLQFSDGVEIDGTILMAQVGGTNNSLGLAITGPGTPGSEFSLGLQGQISAYGLAGNALIPAGGNGGAVTITEFDTIIMFGNGLGVQSANIWTYGGDATNAGANAGAGGALTLTALTICYAVEGGVTLLTHGGTASGTAPALGGAGGDISLSSSATTLIPSVTQGVYFDGILTSTGGNGTSGGGPGGVITLGTSQGIGQIICSGSMTASGGSAAATSPATASGPGAVGGDVTFLSAGNSIIITSSITSGGGAGTGANGANGGNLFLASVQPSIVSGPRPLISGGLGLSGAILLSGGSSDVGSGGNGGNIMISEDQNNALSGVNPINIVGYDTNGTLGGIDASGGQGATGLCGAGGPITIGQLVQTDNLGQFVLGGIQNTVPLFSQGGATGGPGPSGGTGGAGGSITIGTQMDFLTPVGAAVPPTEIQGASSADRSVENQAPVFVSGGSGDAAGGAAGVLILVDNFSAINSGNLTATGGGSNIAAGGGGGSLTVFSHTAAENAGTADVSGASGASGGGGGNILVSTTTFGLFTYSASSSPSSTAINTQALKARGGASGLGAGGTGGSVNVSALGNATNSGATDVTGGNSGPAAPVTPNGNGGSYLVQGQLATSQVSVNAYGGNGSVNGGNGGTVRCESSVTGTSVFHGAINVAGGTGGTTLPGTVNIDGANQALTNGTRTF